MFRPLRIPKSSVGAHPSVIREVRATEFMHFAAAAASLECRSALVKGPAAANAVLMMHRALLAPELVQALEIVGSYTTLKVIFTVTPSHPPRQFASFKLSHNEPF